jgi:predicted transcriptional regulator YdeE
MGGKEHGTNHKEVRGSFRAVGLRYYGDDSDVVKMASKLWEQFNKRMTEVRDAVPGCAYGLMRTDIDPVSMEKWDYMVCIEVRNFKDIPEEMVEVEVPNKHIPFSLIKENWTN